MYPNAHLQYFIKDTDLPMTAFDSIKDGKRVYVIKFNDQEKTFKSMAAAKAFVTRTANSQMQWADGNLNNVTELKSATIG